MKKMGQQGEPLHPYVNILAYFRPTDWQVKTHVPQTAPPLEHTKSTFVDTLKSLNEMLGVLREEQELAYALKYAEQTKFRRHCALMQIATRTRTFLIDADMLRDELRVLNEIWSNPRILKVSYKRPQHLACLAESFGLWVVNFFDIWSAGRMLRDKKADKSFKDMLHGYLYVNTIRLEYKNWSARPLRQDHVMSARMRVHYLLYIKDILRNRLVEKNLIHLFYQKCTRLCLGSAKPDIQQLISYEGPYKANRKKEGSLNPQQLECFRLLYNWRHKTAKENDKPVSTALSIQAMFKLSRALPSQIDAVAKCFPDGVLPPLVKQNLQEMHGEILQAIRNERDTTIPSYAKKTKIPENNQNNQDKMWDQVAGQKRSNEAAESETGETMSAAKRSRDESSSQSGGWGVGWGAGSGVAPNDGSELGPWGLNSQDMGQSNEGMGVMGDMGYGSSGMGHMVYGSSGMGHAGYGSSEMGHTGYGSSEMGHTGYGSSEMGHMGYGSSEMGQMGYGSSGMGHIGYGSSEMGHMGYGSSGMGQMGYGSSGMGHMGYGSSEMGHMGYGGSGMGHMGYGSSGMGYMGFGTSVMGHTGYGSSGSSGMGSNNPCMGQQGSGTGQSMDTNKGKTNYGKGFGPPPWVISAGKR